MSIEWQYGKQVFVCDECQDPLETEETDWNEAQSVRKKAGWIAVQDEDTKEWLHYCKDCK